MNVDASFLVDVLGTGATGIAALCAAVATVRHGRGLARARWSAEMSAAARAAGGLAYQALVTAAGKPASTEVLKAAIAVGARHVVQAAPLALRALGVTEAGLDAMVTAELGRLLARDPTVSPGPSVAASA